MLINLHLEWWDKHSEKLLRRDNYPVEDKVYTTPIFEIAETDYVQISYTAQGNYTLAVEQSNGEGVWPLEAGEWYSLCDGDEYMFFPGYFDLVVSEGENEFKYKFFVKPKQLEYRNVVYLRDYVNDFYNGLSLNLLEHSQINQFLDLDSQRNRNIIERFSYVKDNCPDLLNDALRYIKQCPTETIKQSTIKTSFRNIDAKAARWLTMKGNAHNEDIMNPNAVLTRKTKYEINTTENQYFKNQLMFWRTEIYTLMKQIDECIELFDRMITANNRKIEEYTEEKEALNSEVRVSRRSKESYDYKIKDLNRENSILQKYMAEYDDKDELRKYKNILEHCLHSTWLTTVDDIKVTRNPKTYQLRNIISYRNDYLGITRKSRKQSADSGLSFSEKSTPSLFETFTYVLLIKMLVEKGFELDEFNTQILLYALSNASTMKFHKDDILCEVRYDTSVLSKDELIESDYCSINSVHNKPDFIVTFRKDGEDVPFASFIVEVKWRALFNIYNEMGDTEVVINLKDYYNLAYYDMENRATHRGAINKVIAVYPDKNQRITEIWDEDIIAVGLLPDQKMENTLGYKEISQVIDQCLESK